MRLIFFLLIMTFQVLSLKADSISIMPQPMEVTMGKDKFGIKGDISYHVTSQENARIKNYLNGISGRFSKQKFPLVFKADKEGKDLIIRYKREGDLKLDEDESYRLNITKNGIEIISETDIGAIRALETLAQLRSEDKEGSYFPEVRISDKPRFSWRGLLLDVSRHFFSVNAIKRNLDGMAAVKMNVFHLHLTDDQGFRIESKRFPKLHERGSNGAYYTQEQIKGIINYAGRLGIRVIPEFDLPGHATSWFAAFPEFASAPANYKPEERFGIFDPAFNPAKEEVYVFLDQLFEEMAALFPDEYFHIGGDENNGKQWDKNQEIQAFMKQNNLKNNHELQAYFNKRLVNILAKHNKKMVGWEEILAEDIPKDIIVQSWRGANSLKDAVSKGYKAILSKGYYIDLVYPADRHYLNDPVPADSELTEEQKQNILGGEATMWSEFVTEENVDSRIWPRTAAIAERLWSQAQVNNVDDMYSRLKKVDGHLENIGLTHNTGYIKMLERIANSKNIESLKALTDLIEPIKEYTRYKQEIKYTVHTPLTQLADAARPDAEAAREFKKRIEAFIKNPDPKEAENILSKLKEWETIKEELDSQLSRAPLLAEVIPVAEALGKISGAGISALEVYLKRKEAKAEGLEQLKAELKEARKPISQCEIMVVSPIDKLVRELYKVK